MAVKLRRPRNPIEAVVDWQLRAETQPVENKHRVALVVIAFAVLAASTAGSVIAGRPDIVGWRWWVYLVLSTPYWLCAGVGIFSVSGMPRKLIWGRGYRAGRESYVRNMAEALERGMHPLEWLAAELERDGYPVRVAYNGPHPVELEAALPASWRPRRPGEKAD